MHVRLVILALVPALVAAATTPGIALAVARPEYRLPVDGEVVAGFDAPADAYAPGHRGVDLAAPTGTSVRAAAAGRVTFAGWVAGERWVTIAHADGVRTSYGPLGPIVAEQGQQVAAGRILGSSGGLSLRHPADRLHFSARVGERYIDPLTLIGGWRPTLVGPGDWRAHDAGHVIQPYDPWEGGAWLGAVAAGSPDAMRPGFAFAPTPNRVIGLAGVMSQTGEFPIDLTHLGYAAEDVGEFSYAGTDDDGRPRPYGAEDTMRGVVDAALALREQLAAHHRRHPDQAVDLVGHSMGGVVAMTYLLFLHDPGDPAMPAIGNVATIAAPLEGTEVATLVRAIRDHDVAGPLVGNLDVVLEAGGPEPARSWARRFDLHGRSIDALASWSPLAMALPARFRAARDDLYGGPLAVGTRVLTLGAQLDPVVPTDATDLPGSTHLVMPGAHGGVTRTEAVREVLHDFLAGEPLPSSPGWGAVGASQLYADAVEGVAVRLYAEQVLRMLRGAGRLTRTPGPGPVG